MFTDHAAPIITAGRSVVGPLGRLPHQRGNAHHAVGLAKRYIRALKNVHPELQAVMLDTAEQLQPGAFGMAHDAMQWLTTNQNDYPLGALVGHVVRWVCQHPTVSENLVAMHNYVRVQDGRTLPELMQQVLDMGLHHPGAVIAGRNNVTVVWEDQPVLSPETLRASRKKMVLSVVNHNPGGNTMTVVCFVHRIPLVSVKISFARIAGVVHGIDAIEIVQEEAYEFDQSASKREADKVVSLFLWIVVRGAVQMLSLTPEHLQLGDDMWRQAMRRQLLSGIEDEELRTRIMSSRPVWRRASDNGPLAFLRARVGTDVGKVVPAAMWLTAKQRHRREPPREFDIAVASLPGFGPRSISVALRETGSDENMFEIRLMQDTEGNSWSMTAAPVSDHHPDIDECAAFTRCVVTNALDHAELIHLPTLLQDCDSEEDLMDTIAARIQVDRVQDHWWVRSELGDTDAALAGEARAYAMDNPMLWQTINSGMEDHGALWWLRTPWGNLPTWTPA